MILKSLSLLHYKNFDAFEFEFDAKINCIVGENGKGKTNILDSIYHLAYTKSYFNPITSQNIQHGQDFFVVDGKFERQSKTENIIVSFKKGQKKIVKRNAKTYDRLSEHVGLIPVVIISPTDRDLILEGSDVRRKFMDTVISQVDKTYLNYLMKYNKVLSQRNALLKYFAVNHTYDSTTLSVYNEQMQDLGQYIYNSRQQFIEDFTPILKQRYQEICQKDEPIQITYKSQLHEQNLGDLFEKSLQKDMALQYTSTGIHKDDLILDIKGYPVKKFGSQGQQKSYLIALKFAQYDYLKDSQGLNPILLLDDIFDKLDENRVKHIVSMVTQQDLGQMFISDTHPDRTENVVKANAEQYKMINLNEFNFSHESV
ncbi:DNA replication/repair protein RecF [Mesohalobacter halotolerans]|uniref:DNA replication and repair protein RecF n=1 Tax=Mesohalobacter halotolerans TaxID=1883405 RepID=A0A4U5TRP3_9FLAO|nr:DNA replication/repair protein RecF [Mesohalobacter halotolerans]TKS56672.1 DNA replication/repair protein RecF [Mesohalobacter halotolerans]